MPNTIEEAFDSFILELVKRINGEARKAGIPEPIIVEQRDQAGKPRNTD